MKRNVVVTLIVLIALCLGACHQKMADFQPPRQKSNGPIAKALPPPPPPPASAVPDACSGCSMQGVPGGVVGGVVGGVAGGVMGGIARYALPVEIPERAALKEKAFVVTEDEATTTFAIDVDRASYANVRRYLSQGMLPPPEAVRIEEMINYFDYDYPQPTGDVPFSITTEVAGCPWETSHRLLRIGIQGAQLDPWRMAPNRLVFLLDVSGSMQPQQRLPMLKSAFRVLVNQLRAEDSVAIVVYAGASGLVLPPTSGADKDTILGALEGLDAGGSTAGGEGIELAYKIAQENFDAKANNRVILATDGDFNVGISSLEELQKLIEAKRDSGIFLTTLGVGDDNYRDSVLELLADKGNGNYAYLDSIQEAEKVFKKELTGTLVTIAKDVKVQLEFNPELVSSYRQIGYENRALENEDFEDDTKDAGELGAGHSVTALYEIVPVSPKSTGTIATLRLRYQEPRGSASRLITSTAIDQGTSAYAASPDLQFAAAVTELGMLLRDSPHKGTSTFADALKLARIARGNDMDGLRAEFIHLADSARVMKGNDRRRSRQSETAPLDTSSNDPLHGKRLTAAPVRRYLTNTMKTTVSSKGQIVLPAELREQDRIEPGEEFTVERLDRGEYRLVRRTPPSNEGVVDWLLACPEKGFFVPIESESTDAL